MSIEYYHPCPKCGVDAKVDARSAGEQRRCACGAMVETPTLRDLRKLRPVTDAPVDKAASWDARRAVIFLGLIIALFSLIGAGVSLQRVRHEKPPIKFSEREVAEDLGRIESLTPFETVVNWSNMRNGPYLMLESRQPDQENLKSTAQAVLGVSAFGVVVGLAMVLAALFFMPSASGG